MTCIAYKNNILAADSQLTNLKEGTITTENKIFAADKHNKIITAETGHTEYTDKLYKWFIAGQKISDFPYDLRENKSKKTGKLIVACHQYGVRVYTSDPYPELYGKKPCAFGSGGLIALGAMEAGATAEKAVKIAIKHDRFSKGPVNKMTIRKYRKLL